MVLNLRKVMRDYELSVMIFSKEGETGSKAGAGQGVADYMKKVVFEIILEEKVGI